MSIEDMIEVFKNGIEHKPDEEAEEMRVIAQSMMNIIDAIHSAERRLERLERKKQIADAVNEMKKGKV